jgi:hypothetical protein
MGGAGARALGIEGTGEMPGLASVFSDRNGERSCVLKGSKCATKFFTVFGEFLPVSGQAMLVEISEVGTAEGVMEGGIEDMRERPGRAVSAGGTFHGTAIPEEEDVGRLEEKLVGGSDHEMGPFGRLGVGFRGFALAGGPSGGAKKIDEEAEFRLEPREVFKRMIGNSPVEFLPVGLEEFEVGFKTSFVPFERVADFVSQNGVELLSEG